MKIEGVLKRGMRGAYVKRLQEELKNLGYYRGSIDGIFGPETEAAVKKFQKEKKLKEDGIVGSRTAKAINDAVAKVPEKKDPLDLAKRIFGLLEKVEDKLCDDQKEEFKKLKGELEKQLKASQFQKNIKATREGTTAEGLRPKTAYGFLTDTDKFVALPCTGLKGKWVEIVLPDGTRAVVPVGDVGPWNGGGTRKEPTKFDDPYWKTNSRPQAESGTDKRGRKTNKAGIDISQKLWEQMGLDPKAGSTRVKWRFVDPPKDGQVEITKRDGTKIKHKNKGG